MHGVSEYYDVTKCFWDFYLYEKVFRIVAMSEVWKFFVGVWIMDMRENDRMTHQNSVSVT